MYLIAAAEDWLSFTLGQVSQIDRTRDNYSQRYSAPLRCYTCTTINTTALLSGVKDQTWRQWLARERSVPHTERCVDPLSPLESLRQGLQTQLCEDGMCMKMWFRERGGDQQVWRSCIRGAAGKIRADCTKISSGEGDMEVCTCEGSLCNAANTPQRVLSGLVVALLVPLVTVL